MPARRLEIRTPYGVVAVWLSGPEDAATPALMLLHANPGDHRDFAPVTSAFERDRLVVGVDWPGFGDSVAARPDEVTVAALGEVATTVVHTLADRGIRRLSIIGNSVGGHAAVRAAQHHPGLVESVVLVQPAGFIPANSATRALCRVMSRPTVARWVIAPSARGYLGPLRSESHRAIYERAVRVRHDPARSAVYRALWRSLGGPDADLGAEAPLLPRTRVQVVWGTRDPINPWWLNRRALARALPHAQIVPLPTRHEPFSENPQLFLRTVRQFLTDQAGSAS
ncbi:alpha/beta fold hydrolase [Nocardia shimofusensis]|uniref:alpha/beta fold hydrolase n=1 Tax=Nocardia shimofusensis TaxID=228596 RepID=UPI0008349F5A|nr:alpha/beta fold hydrolase [Nocardia shimofusensis]